MGAGMASLSVSIVSYKNIVTQDGPYLEITCRTANQASEFVVAMQTPDVMAVLGDACLAIRAAAAPADGTAAAVLMQTILRDGMLAKMVALGAMDA